MFDVSIIGAGPAGLFAGFMCGMLGLKFHICDALQGFGGQCSALYPEKNIYDIPGFKKIKACDLIDNLVTQMMQFDFSCDMNHKVSIIEKTSVGFVIKFESQKEVFAKSIIIASGVGAFKPNKPPVENLEVYENKFVHYSVSNKSLFVDKEIVIAGGGDSAIDWAIELSQDAKSITIVHRRNNFRCNQDNIKKLNALKNAGKIKILAPYMLSKLIGSIDNLSNILVSNIDTNEITTINADHLLVFFGMIANSDIAAKCGIKTINKKHIEVNPLTMETNINGIYAIGDACHYDNRHNLILHGFSEGARAVHSARSFINPNQVFHFEHSSNKQMPT